MKSEFHLLKEAIVNLVADARNQRLRPPEIQQMLAGKLGGSVFTVQEALNDLVREGRLIFTYRDPWSYVELPGASVLPAAPVIPRNEYERLKEEVLATVQDSENQRLRPHDLGKTLVGSWGGSEFTIQQAINDLVREERLVFTYRDPASFVELVPAARRQAV